MTRRRWISVLAAAAVAVAVACSGGDSPAAPAGGSTANPAAVAATEERAAAPFSHVIVDGPLAVTVRQKTGAPERVEVTSPDGGHANVTTSVDDGVIEVGVAGDVLPGTSVLLRVAELESVRVANGATVSLIGELDLPVFEASASAGSSVLASEVRSGASGGIWELAANGASTVDLSAIPVSAVDLEVTGGSRVTIDVLTSVLGVVEAGSTLEVIGDPGHLEVTGGGTVRAMGPRETGESAPEPAVAARPDGLTGAPLPPPDTAVVAFDEERFFSGAGTFPALTDPVVVAASEATWLEDETLVLGATQNGEARAYPIFQLRFHHVSNDVLGGKPYLVTF